MATTPGIPQPSDSQAVVLAPVRLLLERGADVNGRRGDGVATLHAACSRGMARAAQELLEDGAAPALTATAEPHQGRPQRPKSLARQRSAGPAGPGKPGGYKVLWLADQAARSTCSAVSRSPDAVAWTCGRGCGARAERMMASEARISSSSTYRSA